MSANESRPAPTLSGAQRRHLRGLAHKSKPIVFVGEGGLSGAVVKALDWFQTTQQKNGSWGGGYTVAYTGLALLAYLGHCETPLSEKYGDTVTNAIIFLVDSALP